MKKRTQLITAVVAALAVCSNPVQAEHHEKDGVKVKTSAKASDADHASNAHASRNEKESMFVHKAAMGTMMEIQMGKMAQEKGESQGVKDFGKKLVEDHTMVQTELTRIAQQQGITLGKELDEKHQKDMAHCQELSGAEFDKSFIKHMVKDHQKDVAEFEKQSRMAKDPQIKQFAAKTLPTLKQHLMIVQGLAKQHGVTIDAGAGAEINEAAGAETLSTPPVSEPAVISEQPANSSDKTTTSEGSLRGNNDKPATKQD